jgi:hypothetical protein
VVCGAADRVKSRRAKKKRHELRQFCVAAMTGMRFLATLLPSLRPPCDFSIAFYWRSDNDGQKIPANMSNFICIAKILLRCKKL